MITLTRLNGYLNSYYQIPAMGHVCIPLHAGTGSGTFRELGA